MSVTVSDQDNPLLKDFDFPPFDCVNADHVRPGVRALLKKVVSIVSNLTIYCVIDLIRHVCVYLIEEALNLCD